MFSKPFGDAASAILVLHSYHGYRCECLCNMRLVDETLFTCLNQTVVVNTHSALQSYR